MFSALFEYHFLQNAFIAGIFASIVCGVIGVIIVEKKLIMMSGGIAHTAYGGVGLGYLLGFEPIIGAFIFALGSAWIIGFLKRKNDTNSDIIIGLLWSLGMALGILFIALMPGYPPDMTSYLFGNILSITRFDLILMIILTIVVMIVIFSFFDTWQAYLFDEEFAFITGLKTNVLEYVLLSLIALAIVVLIRVVGIILVLALLTAPAAIAGLLVKGFKKRMLIATLLGMLFCISGLWFSYELNIASGASIVIISVLCYIIVYGINIIKQRKIKAS